MIFQTLKMKTSSFKALAAAALLIVLSLEAGAQNPPGNTPYPQDSTRVLRILSYNILHGETMKGDFDLDRIAAVIKSTNPDLVALQEVDFFTRRARNMDLATELGQRTGLAPLFGSAMPYDGGAYGEGVLSRLSFLNTRNHGLPAGPGKEPRAALEVQVVLGSGDTIRFVGTHLDHTSDEVDRIGQARALNALFSGDKMPAILAGDLNALPDSETMSILYQEWEGSSPDLSPTFPSKNPEVKIDYVLFRPTKRWRLIESRVIADSVASDHCGLLSILELLPE